jgi:hypothetical protein
LSEAKADVLQRHVAEVIESALQRWINQHRQEGNGVTSSIVRLSDDRKQQCQQQDFA